MPILVRVALTIGFLVAGGLCLRRCAAGAGVDRLNDATHVLMSVVMLALVWWRSVPGRDVQLTVFAVAAGWFIVQATGVPLRAAALPSGDLGVVSSRAADHCRARNRSRLGCLHHAVLMLTTVWMLAVSSGMTMAAMSMPGSPPAHPRLPLLVGTYCLAVTPLCAVAAARAWRRGSRTFVAEPIMTAAMAGMALLMA